MVTQDLSPLEDLERCAKLREQVDEMTLKAVKKARKRGLSWYKIGPALGVTRQAAAEKYASKVGK